MCALFQQEVTEPFFQTERTAMSCRVDILVAHKDLLHLLSYCMCLHLSYHFFLPCKPIQNLYIFWPLCSEYFLYFCFIRHTGRMISRKIIALPVHESGHSNSNDPCNNKKKNLYWEKNPCSSVIHQIGSSWEYSVFFFTRNAIFTSEYHISLDFFYGSIFYKKFNA